MQIPEIYDHYKAVTSPVKSWKAGGHTWHALHEQNCEIVKLELVFDVGTADQEKSLQANFTSNLLLEGTSSNNALEFSRKLDELGAYFSSECGRDYTSFTLHVLAQQLKKALAIVGEIFRSPALTQEEFDNYLFEAKEEFKHNCAQTPFLAKQKLRKLLYANHPYGQVAEASSFEKIQLSDIDRFAKAHFIHHSCQIFVSGNASESTCRTISNFLTIDQPSISAKRNPQPFKGIAGRQIIHHPNAQQDSVRLGIRFPESNHADFLPLNLLSSVLGGYFGSRLMQNIREEKGLTYGIGSSILPGLHGNALMISSDVKQGSGPLTVDEIEKEFKRLQDEEISLTELNQACSYLKGNLLRSFDGVFEQMDRYQSLVLNQLNQDHYDQYFELLNKPNSIALRELAQKYLNASEFTVVIAQQ